MAKKPVGGAMTFLISFCALLLVFAVGAILVMTMGQDTGVPPSQGGGSPPAGMDKNAVLLDQEEPEEYNPSGTVQYQINSSPFFSSGSSEGSLMILSRAANVDLIRVEIALEEDDTSVYQSDFIAPGYGVPTAELAVKLRDGVYPAVAAIQVYDADTQEYLGLLKEALTLYIGETGE